MLGDATLFTRSDEIEEQWALVDAIVVVLAARPASRSRTIAAGTWGPVASDELHPPGWSLVAQSLIET